MNQEVEQVNQVNWVVTPGVAHINNIIRVHIFRHYEKHVTTYKLLAIGNLDPTETQLGIYEVEEIVGLYKGMAVSPIFRNFALSTCLFKGMAPCIIVLVRIDNDLILMSKEEFEKLSATEDEEMEEYNNYD